MGVFETMTARISRRLARAGKRLGDREFLEREIAAWLQGPARAEQVRGHLYCEGRHDILRRKRTVIGEDGAPCEITNLPNNRLVDNQFGKLVEQKTNYLLGQPFVLECADGQFARALRGIFGKRFMRVLQNAGRAALCGGIAWLFPCYDAQGELTFRLFPAYEVLPLWRDSEHTALDCAVRMYDVQGYEGSAPTVIHKAEVYTQQGIRCFVWRDGRLWPDTDAPDGDCAYVTLGGKPLSWQRIPLIAVKANGSEIPLLRRVKCLQDALNAMLSDFENNMQEDARNTILVLKNYDGTNLGEFRRNLAQYGAVKVRSEEGSGGGVETLEVSFSAENYKSILSLLKTAIIENGMGYDAKDDRLAGNPNQMNIQSMYSDIDLDANGMETELQAAFEELLWFARAHLRNTGQGDFSDEEVTVTFNRDMLMNETEAIANCAASAGLLSEETLIAQHPWVDDPHAELERLRRQRETYAPFAENPPRGEEAAGRTLQ